MPSPLHGAVQVCPWVLRLLSQCQCPAASARCQHSHTVIGLLHRYPYTHGCEPPLCFWAIAEGSEHPLCLSHVCISHSLVGSCDGKGCPWIHHNSIARHHTHVLTSPSAQSPSHKLSMKPGTGTKSSTSRDELSAENTKSVILDKSHDLSWYRRITISPCSSDYSTLHSHLPPSPGPQFPCFVLTQLCSEQPCKSRGWGTQRKQVLEGATELLTCRKRREAKPSISETENDTRILWGNLQLGQK